MPMAIFVLDNAQSTCSPIPASGNSILAMARRLPRHGRRHHKTKRQVDTFTHWFRSFGDLVYPPRLGGTAHHEHAPVGQFEMQTLVTEPAVAHVEPARRAQAHGRDHRVVPELGLVVGMPRHTVT